MGELQIKTTFIYFLKDPRPDYYKGYIGKSNDPIYRFEKGHWVEATDYEKNRWLNKLKKLGLKPTVEILDEVPANTREEWGFWERWYVELFKSWGFELVNSRYCLGGEGFESGSNNPMKNPETVKKLKATRKLKGLPNYSEETRKKMREAKLKNPVRYWKGKKRSVDDVKKMSLGHKGIVAWNKGIPCREETKKKLSKANKGHKPTNTFPVLQYDKAENFIAEFASANIAENLFNKKGKGDNICACIRGSQKTAYGYIWKRKQN